ncbi:MAG: TolC family protein [Acidobacteria bacterium]|nr:TolC family protein [Acidobacteriota bacterium]
MKRIPSIAILSLLVTLPLQEFAARGQERAAPETSGSAVAAQAQGETAEEVFLNDLIAEALKENRELRVAQSKYQAALARRSVASSPPDLRLSVASANIGNPVPATTLGSQDMSQLGFEVMQDFPTRGKLQLQGKIAQKEADAERHGYREVELKIISELKQAFYRWRYLEQAKNVIAKNFDLLQKFETIAEARYSVGKGVQQDALRAQLELTALEQKLVELDRQEGSMAAKINSLLNRPPDSPLGVPGEYAKAALPASLEELYRAAQVNFPGLRQEQTKIEKSTYEVELARKDYYPNFSVGGGWFSRGGLRDMWTARVDISLPIYFWRKQRFAVRESAEMLRQSQRQYEATWQKLNFRVKDEYLMVKASEQLLELYSKASIPQSSLALDSAMASYQVGNVDFLSLLTNFMSVLEYELNYHEEFANFHQALARLEELTGLGLTR